MQTEVLLACAVVNVATIQYTAGERIAVCSVQTT